MEKYTVPAKDTLETLTNPGLGLLLWAFVLVILFTVLIAAISWVRNHDKPHTLGAIFDSLKVWGAALLVVGIVFAGVLFTFFGDWTGFHFIP